MEKEAWWATIQSLRSQNSWTWLTHRMYLTNKTSKVNIHCVHHQRNINSIIVRYCFLACQQRFKSKSTILTCPWVTRSYMLVVSLGTALAEGSLEQVTGWICLSPFHFPLLSSWPPLSPSSLSSSLYNSMNISERSRLWSTHKEVSTG